MDDAVAANSRSRATKRHDRLPVPTTAYGD